jgi:cell wall assembly regulator SMI1
MKKKAVSLRAGTPKRTKKDVKTVPHEEDTPIARAWSRLDRALEKFKRPPAAKLSRGASAAAFEKFAAKTRLSLPHGLRGYWGAHDGQASDFGLAAGFRFLSLSEAAKTLADWAATRKQLGDSLKMLDRSSRSHPPGAIQKKYSLPGWLPLLSDGEGNHIGVDLDPGPSGKVGQVINFGRDEEEKYVLFPSVVDLVEWLADEYAARRVVFDKEDKVICHVEGRLTGVLVGRVEKP